MKKIFLTTLTFFALAIAVVVFLVLPQVSKAANEGGVSVGVTVTNCGNSIRDLGEACDSGSSNGPCPASCSLTCTENSCGSCFLSGTKILLPDYTWRNIEDIRTGDYVLSTNVTNGMFAAAVVQEIEAPKRTGYYVINDKLRLTSEHPLYIKKIGGYIGWGAIDKEAALVDHRLRLNHLEMSALVVGDFIKKSDGQWERVQTLVYHPETVQTYNLVNLAPYNTYFADGYLAHNKGEDSNGPSISVVTTSVANNTFYIKWSLSDPSGVATTSFGYGIGGYASSAAVVDLGGNFFEANITGLNSNTSYLYKITAVDLHFPPNTSAQADTFTTTNVIVTDAPPQISAVSSLVGYTTTTLSWTVTDDHGVSSTSLVYGTSISYGLNGAVVGSYGVNLSDLLMNTTYYYKIFATDSNSQTVSSTGSFTTLGIDLTPPIISNVSSTPGVTTAVITFDTNELATSQVSYGSNTSYGSSAPEGEPANTTHSVILPGLLPNRTYHFKVVATDTHNNEGATGDFFFTTLPDHIPPPNVTAYQLTTTSNSIILNWTNPDLLTTPDFSGVKIVRSINSQATGPNDPGASLTHTTSAETFTDDNVLANIDYYYSIFSFDTSGNYSSGVYRVGKIIQVSREVCGNGVDDDGNGKTDCADDVCKNLPSCVTPTEICNNGLDDDGDGKTDCLDPDCDSSCKPTGGEICNNGLDDDGDGKIDCLDPDCTAFCTTGGGEVCNNGLDDDVDGKIDCLDPDCSSFAGCQITVAVCNNGVDDDSDSLVDFPSDPGCSSINDSDEYNAPTTTVPEFARIDFSKLLFLAGNRQIVLVPQNKTVTSLANSGLSLGVPLSALNGRPKSLTLHSGGQNYQFSFSSSSETYFTDIVFPVVGSHEASLEIDYGSDQFDSALFYLNSLPDGQVSGPGGVLSGVEVNLMQKGGVKPYLGVYGEQNPSLTDVNGLYGWVVPNGEYYLEIKKDGFHTRTTPIFKVNNNVVNSNVKLIKVAENLLETVQTISQLSVQKITDITNDPNVQKTATEIVTPAVVGITAVGTVAAVSWFNLISLLRFLFLQPLMLFGRRKREKWGMVYHTLTKLPVDLAIVRLFNVETNRLIQSKVTDGQGRYAFIVARGKYRLEVQKANLVFPSVLLKNFKNDGEKLDIYHGEVIEVTEENSLITANIPLDPIGEVKTPGRIRREKIWRRLQTGLSWFGFLVTLVSLYISPVWYMWVLLVVHLFILAIFRRITKPKRAKGWGIVYDSGNNSPVARVVARLFDSQFNKLVATEVTDRNGRYHFLAGDSKYYVTYEHHDYEPTKVEVTGSAKKDGGAITEDVKIKKKIS